MLLLFLFMVPVTSSTSGNLCSTAGRCCKHRDSTCVAQKLLANKSVDTSALPCYCDQACIRLDDCCPDYREFCSVRDCVVSEFGPWSPCPIDDDGRCVAVGDAFSERRRVILHQSLNGGRKCPSLVQKRPCLCNSSDMGKAAAVSEDQQQPERSPRVHHLVRSSGGSAAQEGEEDGYCVAMITLGATSGCRDVDQRMVAGTPICIQCRRGSDGAPEKDSSFCPASSMREARAQIAASASHIRKFRVSRRCRGRLVLVDAYEDGGDCRRHCEEGLVFALMTS